MLTLVLGWILLLAACGTIGLGALAVLRVSFDELADTVVVAAWSGLALLGSLLLLTSVLVALSPLVVAMVASVLTIASITLRAVRSAWAQFAALGRRATLGAGLLLLVVAGLFTRPVTLFDSGAYHLGIIEWLSRFGSVPGIVLLHVKLGFGSSWFALGAAFNHGFLHGRSAGLLGGVAVLLGIAHIGVFGERVLRRRARSSDVFALVGLAVVLLSMASDLMISPSPDVPASILLVEAAWLVYKACEATTSDQRQSLVTGAVVLASAAGAMKLSTLPLALMILVFAVLLHFPLRRLLVLSGIALVLVGPMLASNTVTSGCPIFPSAPCADVDWAISNSDRADVQTIIVELTRGQGLNEDRTWINWVWREWILGGVDTGETLVVLGVTGLAFGAIWFAFRRRPWCSTAAMASLGGLLVVAILMRRAPNVSICLSVLLALLAVWKAREPGARVTALMGLAGVGFVLVNGPLLRYGAGYVAMCVAAFATVGLGRLGVPARTGAPSERRPVVTTARQRGAFIAGGLAILLVTIVYVPGFGKGLSTADEVFVPPRVQDAIVERFRARDFSYDAALTTKECWLSDLPCTEDVVPQDRVLRDPGQGIGGGFVRVR